MKLIIFLLLSFALEANAMKFKVRAREHVETHKIDINGAETTYKGLSNTINLWWEMPYELYYGFYISPVFSSLEEDESGSPLGEEIHLFSAGFAGKYFVHKLIQNTYLRLEIGYSELRPDNSVDDATGVSYLIGYGYEFPLEMFGLALEAAYRYSDLSDNTTVKSFTPSIGFHFYEVF